MVKQHYSTTLTNTIFVTGHDGVVVISNILRGMVRYNSSTLADINNSVAGDDDYQDTTLIDGQCV